MKRNKYVRTIINSNFNSTMKLRNHLFRQMISRSKRYSVRNSRSNYKK